MTRMRVRRRSGFTLIEMGVVIVIMAVIAGLAVTFLPTLDRNKGVPNAVTQLEGWVRLGKAQALRDGAPRGVRLITDPNDPTRVTALQYIEQPEPVSPRGPNMRAIITTINPAQPLPPPYPNPAPTSVSLNIVDNTGTPISPVSWVDQGVAAGDFLELAVAPYGLYQIAAVGGANNSVLQLVPGKSIDGTDIAPMVLADGYSIVRAPRPLVGEPMLQMNKDVFIDVATSVLPPSLSGNADILFNSAGQVANAPLGQIYLVVVHGDRPTDRLIVVVYTRTGKIGAVDWNDDGGDPYAFARDGRSTGF